MLDELPAELKERGDEIRRLDIEVKSRQKLNQQAINDFFERTGINMSDEQKNERHKEFQDEIDKIRQLSQRKYFIAEKMQELLKKYLVHLEKEKTNFQCEMEADNSGVTEMIEKRYTQHLESMLTVRKDRKRRHRSPGGGSSRASTIASGPLLSRESNDKIQKILQEGMRLRLDLSDDSAAHSALSSAIPSPAPRGRPPKASKDPLMLSSAMIASDDCMTPVPTPTVRRRSNTNALRGTVSIPTSMSMHRSESTGRYSPNPSERSWSNAGIDESPTPTHLTTPTFSSGPHTIGPNFSTPQSAQLLQNSAFIVSESRHGRPRKLTTRVQEMFKETLQRQRNHGNSIIALQEKMSAANLAAAQQATSPQESDSPMNTTRNGSPVDDDYDSSYGTQRRNYDPSDDEEEGDARNWCFCNEGSHGDMIKCDNADCTLRWFHYPCIGMVEPPKGKWYCPRCVVNSKLAEDGEDI